MDGTRASPQPLVISTLVCLHCSGSSGRQFDAVAASLSAGNRIATPNLMGYEGTQRWPTGRPASLADEASRIAAHLPDHGAHLIGHSYGGAVALEIALRWPARVRSLTLYEPVRFALLAAAHPGSMEAIVSVGRRIALDVISGSLHAAAARFVDYWSGEGAWARMSTGRRQAVADVMPKVHAEFEALFADRVPAAAYGALAMPVHFVGGTRSPLPARQVSDVLAGVIGHATRAVLEGVGHMGPITHPAQFVAALPAWMHDRPLAVAA